jgi:hypothetical protein
MTLGRSTEDETESEECRSMDAPRSRHRLKKFRKWSERRKPKGPAVSSGALSTTKVGDVLLGDVLCPALQPAAAPSIVRPL